MTQTPDIWTLHTTNPREGESSWGGCYIIEADAEKDAASMRKATGLDWEVVPMVRAVGPATQMVDAAPNLGDAWKHLLLNGAPLERDKYGCGYHPALPNFDEGVNGRTFFAVFGIELKASMADNEMESDAYEAMTEFGFTEDGPNYNVWNPERPKGEGWHLVAIFDTEDGPACWWLREKSPTKTQRQDEAAVDELAERMKAKLEQQREKGYSGWNNKRQCTQQHLSNLLREHVDKDDPVDVANFCAFLLARGEGIAAAPQAVQPAVPQIDWEAAATEIAIKVADNCGTVPNLTHPHIYLGLQKLFAPTHAAEGVPPSMPVAHPHHCTARTADGSCEECEGHAQAMAEWNTERAALAATQPAAQDLQRDALKLARDRLADMLKDDDGQAWKEARKAMPIIDAAIAVQAKQMGT